jgi:hypothetical protein
MAIIRILKKKPGQLKRRELKTRRRELRLTASADDLIACAIAISGLTAGDLAYEGARRLLEDHERRQHIERDDRASKPVRLRR